MTPTRIAIIGAGTMGRGIGISCAQAGFHTKIFDMNERTLCAVVDRADRYFKRRAEKEKMSQAEAAQSMTRFQLIRDLKAIRGSAIVIEAIHEDLGAKQNLFWQVSSIIDQTAIIATKIVCALASRTGQKSPTQGLDRFFSWGPFGFAVLTT